MGTNPAVSGLQAQGKAAQMSPAQTVLVEDLNSVTGERVLLILLPEEQLVPDSPSCCRWCLDGFSQALLSLQFSCQKEEQPVQQRRDCVVPPPHQALEAADTDRFGENISRHR